MTAGPWQAPGRPPAVLVVAVLLVHVLAWRAWKRPAVLQEQPVALRAQLILPMPLLPADTAPVVTPPHAAAPGARRAPRDGRPATPPGAPERDDASAHPAARVAPPAIDVPTPADAQAMTDTAAQARAPITGVTPWPATARVPASARWQYVAMQQRRGLLSIGTGALDWSHDGARYSLQLAWDLGGLPPRSQTSVGTLDGRGLAPRRYGVRGRSEFATHLDAVNARVVFSSNRPQQPWSEGLQDRASVLLQVAGWLAADPGRFTPGTVLRVSTVGSHEAADWDFTVQGLQVLDLPGGRLETVHLTRAPTGPWDLRLEAWFAPGMAYAPVRLRLTPPTGDWLDLQWSGTDSR